uniref:Uncharacterized protein n=1 Tax=Panagrolaimus davidi TaxID=227884 RepID=A0A914PQM5_9BILA
MKCDRQFGETNCVGDGEWVGGIHPRSFNNERLVFRCCRNSLMETSKFQKVLDLTANDEFKNGGDVYSMGKLIGFDYISNVIKFDADQGTMYEVYVNRIFCKKSLDNVKVFKSNILPVHSISNTEDAFVETTKDENLARKYVHDHNPKVYQVPLIETQDVNTIAELQNNNILPQETSAVAEQQNNGISDEASSGACSTCTGIQVVTGTQLGTDLPLTQTTGLDASGCSIITVTCSSANPNEPISLNWAAQGINAGTTIGIGSVTETLSCNNNGQLILNEQNAGIVEQAVCVSRELLEFFGNKYFFLPPPPPPPLQPLPPPVQPIQPAQYYPVATDGGSLLNYLCFSADTLVKTIEGTKKRMDELNINDWILSGSSENGEIGYSKVMSWIHRKPNFMAEFIKFTLANGKYLKISNKHYIYKGNCENDEIATSPKKFQVVFAENVSIHDCLYTLNSKNELIETRISSIEMVQEKGIYAPLTETGTIIVNNIFASCYSNVDAKYLHYSLPSFTEVVKNVFSFFHLGHMSSSSSFSKEYDLIPGFKFMVQILKEILL